MAEKKENSLKWVFIHGFCYGGVTLLISLPVLSDTIVITAILMASSHLVIDIVKYVFLKYRLKENKKTLTVDRNAFFIDQIMHIGCLILITYWSVVKSTIIVEYKVIHDFFLAIGQSESVIISWIMALLLIHKPANIAIQKLLIIYKPEMDDEDKKRDKNAGRFIGTLERIIMLIFLSIGQYSAIGLVLTAKSIARYDRISKEKDFAEYYLLGTLISTVIVILCSFIVK